MKEQVDTSDESSTSRCVTRLHTMNYPKTTRQRSTARRIVPGSVRMKYSVMEEIKLLEAVLPRYNKRKYHADDRLSLALSFAAYLEGLIVTSSPGNAAPSHVVPLISEFALYHVADDGKEVSQSTPDSPDVTTADKPGDTFERVHTEHMEQQDSSASNCSQLFPELQQFPNESDTDSPQTCCLFGDSLCCCPPAHLEKQDKATGNKSQVVCETPCSKKVASKKCKCLFITEKDDSKHGKTDVTCEVTSDEYNLAERAKYIHLVLCRMEAAVKVARHNTVSQTS